MRKLAWFSAGLLLVAACDPISPTLTPTHALSGPTLAPSPVVRPQLPTNEPFEFFGPGSSNPTAAAVPAGGDLPPLAVGTPNAQSQAVQVTTQDGVILPADLYESGTARVPGILMIAPDRAGWLDLPPRLRAAGFTVLSVNLRDSTNIGEFEALIQEVSNIGTVDPARIAVVGAEGGADLALLGCAADLLCDAAALISPTQPTLVGVLAQYNPRPLFIAAARQDASFAVLQALQANTQGPLAYSPLEGAGSGTALLQAHPDLSGAILQWLQGQFAG
jgi:poly(3-hydroxybutyrate) depolymerase